MSIGHKLVDRFDEIKELHCREIQRFGFGKLSATLARISRSLVAQLMDVIPEALHLHHGGFVAVDMLGQMDFAEKFLGVETNRRHQALKELSSPRDRAVARTKVTFCVEQQGHYGAKIHGIGLGGVVHPVQNQGAVGQAVLPLNSSHDTSPSNKLTHKRCIPEVPVQNNSCAKRSNANSLMASGVSYPRSVPRLMFILEVKFDRNRST